MDSRKDHKGRARIGPAWVDRLAVMRRSPADLEVTGADQQKRYTRDVGGDRVQLVDLDPDAGGPDPDRRGSTRPEIAVFVSPDTNTRRYRRRRRDLVRTGWQDRERATGGERREKKARRKNKRRNEARGGFVGWPSRQRMSESEPSCKDK